jgi:hypothetical protein
MWRDTSRQARVFGIDIRALFPLAFFFLHIRLWTLIVCVICIFALVLIERRQMDIPVALRALRAGFWRLWGNVRPATSRHLTRRNNRF